MNGEPGAEQVAAVLEEACLSSVNAAEVVSRLCDRGISRADARRAIDRLGMEIVPFDFEQAMTAGALRPATRALGLSLGDRACLALGQALGLPVLTADRAWGQLSGFDITIIR